MPSSSDIVGSWFPTGYYGHVRSKPRRDFVCEYRHLAKPQPPCKFIARSTQRDTRHSFSLHDNRNTLIYDALYFEQGLGRKRHPEKSANFNRDFYTWMPLKQEIANSLPHLTTYQVNYTRNGVKQLLVQKPRSSFEGSPITTYCYGYGKGDPNAPEIQHQTERARQLTTISRQQEAIRRPPPHPESVASCLNWHRGHKLPQVSAPHNVTTHLSQSCHLPAPPETAKSEMTNGQSVRPQPAPPHTPAAQSSTLQTVSPCIQPVELTPQELLAA